MRKTNDIVLTNPIQNFTRCFVENISVGVMVWLQPFGFEYSPKCLRDIKVRAIRRQEEKVKSSFLPNIRSLVHLPFTMDGCVVQNQYNRFCNTFREVIQKISEQLTGNGVFGIESIIFTIRRNHAEQIKPMFVSGRDEHFFIFEMPSVWHIPAGADMALVSETKINKACLPKFYKFLQLELLEFKQLRRGLSPWAFSYSLISCVNNSKKRLKVISLTTLPELFSHSALAVLILVRCFITAALTASVSEEFISGRVPRPPFSRSPSNPWPRYLLNQLYTASGPYPTNSVISETRFPSAFINIALHRIRNRWHDPKRYAFSSAERSSELNTISFVFPIVFFSLFCLTRWDTQKSCHIL